METKKIKVVDLFSRSSTFSTFSKNFIINPALFNFSNFFLLQSFLLLSKMRQKHINKKGQKLYQDITSGFTSASALYSSQKILKPSTLSQVDITDISDYSNKSNTCQNSINISIIVSSPQVSSEIQIFIAKKL